MDVAKQVAQGLLDKGAVRVSIDPPFTWTSGIKSPIYCDNRLMISFPEERKMIVDAFKAVVEEKGWAPDVIGGTATAAIPWAAFLAQAMDLPMVYIRPQKKEHGAGKQIEGKLEAGQKVLIVEDLISTGGSSVKSVEAVREEGGCVVEDILAIVTYEFDKSRERFEAANVNATTLTDITNIIQVAGERGDIPADQIDLVVKFKENPVDWWEKMGA